MANQDIKLTHDGKEIREHEHHIGNNEHGKSTTIILCPFCGATTEAYTWSLAGSGKRCWKCKSVHRRSKTVAWKAHS